MKTSYLFFATIFFLIQSLAVKADGLKISLGNDNSTSSTELLFTPTSTPGFEKGLDQEYHKAPGNHLNYIYSIAGAKHKLYVNYMQKPSAYTAIDLQIVVGTTGTFYFSVEDRSDNLSDLQFSLTDETGKTIAVTPEEKIELTFAPSDVHSKKNYTFHIFPAMKISSSPVSCSASTDGSISVSLKGDNNCEARLLNGSSKILQTEKYVKDNIRFENLAAGIYFVEIWNNTIKIREEIIAVSRPTNLRSAFSLSDDTVSSGQRFSTDNLSFGGDHWLWEFGDNSTASGYDASHFYTMPGDYTITLTTSNSSGCTAKSSKNIHVETSPINPIVNGILPTN
jgi:hypothetical protein